jgi:hypothetical protein
MNFLKKLFAPKDKRSLAEIVGPLKANPGYAGCYESVPIPIPYFSQSMKITFSKGNESIFMEGAEVVLKRFLQLTEEDRLSNSKMVERYYGACVKELGAQPLNISSAKEVCTLVTPTQVFIEQNIKGRYYVTISCKCEWEKTYGLQLVFREGKKLTRANGHDGQYEDWS